MVTRPAADVEALLVEALVVWRTTRDPGAVQRVLDGVLAVLTGAGVQPAEVSGKSHLKAAGRTRRS